MRKRLCLSVEEYVYEVAERPIHHTQETYWNLLPGYIKNWYSHQFENYPYVNVKEPLDDV